MAHNFRRILTAVFVLYLLGLPLGVAGQNIVLSIMMLTALFVASVHRQFRSRFIGLCRRSRVYLVASVGIILPIFISTLVNQGLTDALKFLLGHSLLFIMPLVISSFDDFNEELLTKVLLVVAILMAIVCASQLMTGWKIEGSGVEYGFLRAQGFYSHPLTLAYVALCFVPLVLSSFFKDIFNIKRFVILSSVVVVVLSSQSVTCLALTVLLLLIHIKFVMRSDFRVKAMIAIMFLSGAVLFTRNPISNKVLTVLSGQRGDHETEYFDDRVAFWLVGLEMVKDKPILGHGSSLSEKDRAPYYDKMGLGHLKRKYEAHNMFIQMAIEGGVISLFSFVVLLGWLVLEATKYLASSHLLRPGFMLFPVTFALGGLTQNAFQDSEVRYAFFGVVSLLFWILRREPTHPTLKLQ